ncbi:unnamed protein product [Ceratitis capitata]|uniref:(Mediterranean fruit fly) hypothetical protein n=1 Tax=Ceratitis capitata TaxID=7213 RepID=A0A811UJF8_CERCA|nr:unnamed protein product [Ceratitis capitata]
MMKQKKVIAGSCNGISASRHLGIGISISRICREIRFGARAVSKVDYNISPSLPREVRNSNDVDKATVISIYTVASKVDSRVNVTRSV